MGSLLKQGFIFGVLVVLSNSLRCCFTFNVDLNTSYLVLRGHKDDPNNTFGYSVAPIIFKGALEPLEIFIGAPTTKLRDGTTTGSFYICKTVQKKKRDRVDCEPQSRVTKDEFGDDNGQWFGASISAHDGDYVICAPRFINKDSEIIGRCYKYDDATKQQGFTIPSDTLRTTPIFFCSTIIIRSWMKIQNLLRTKVNGCDDVGYGLAGSSVKMLRNKFVVYGTPGARAGSGALMVETTGTAKLTSEEGTNNFYMGYSTTSGNFDSDDTTEEIVGGMPRGEVTGMVVIYSHTRDRKQSLYPPTKVKNRQEFIAYGAAVCAVDLNADGVDDLLVGAPFYSDVGDEGRVYVHINQKAPSDIPIFKLSSGANDPDPGLKGSNQPGSRFGSAIASVGDLDFDNYNDVVIGAPLGGPDNNGAIFIYHGTNTGINEKPAQMITAEMMMTAGASLTPPLAGLNQFGYSVAGGIDTDENEYPDIVVGSWGSNNAILLRTRPVMDIRATLKLSRTELPVENSTKNCPDNKTQCLDATACFKYAGKGISGLQNITVELELDPEPRFKRVYFVGNNDEKLYKQKTPLQINKNAELCVKFDNIHVAKRDELVLSASSENIINFQVRYWLAYDPKCATELCPILTPKVPSVINEKATLIFNCTDNTCDYDLTIDISSQQKSIVIGGEVPTLLTEVRLTNKDEKAYNPEVTVYHDPSLQYEKLILVKGRIQRRSIESGNVSTTELFRVLGAIDGGQEVIFQLQYSTRKVDGKKSDLSIKVVAQGTSGQELKTHDNNATLIIPVRRDIAFAIVGTSVPKALTYPIKAPDLVMNENETDYTNVNASSVGPLIKVTFEITNTGRSPLSAIDLKVSYPLRERGKGNEKKYVVYPLSVKPSTCKPGILNPEKLNLDEDVVRRIKRATVELDVRRRQGQSITCLIDQLERDDKVTIEFNGILWLPTLTKLHPNDVILTINAVGIYTDSLAKNKNTSKTVNSAEVKIRLTPQNVVGPAKTTPIWVIIVSILGGILLLALLFFALFKFGFFKRNRPPKDISSPQTDDGPQVET